MRILYLHPNAWIGEYAMLVKLGELYGEQKCTRCCWSHFTFEGIHVIHREGEDCKALYVAFLTSRVTVDYIVIII